MSFNPNLNQGLVFNETAQAKLDRFRADGPDKLAALIDCDKTMIEETTWDIARRGLPEPLRERLERMKQESVGRLDGRQMTADESYAFNVDMLEGFRGQSLEPIRRELALTPLRRGVRTMFTLFECYGVPRDVWSASVQDFIGIVATANGIHPSSIVATKLQIENDRIVGWEEATMTSDMNKHTIGDARRATLANGRTNEIIIGDRQNDTRMASSADALFVRVGGPGKQTPEAYQEESFHPTDPQHYPFDILAGEDLRALNEQLRTILEPDF